MPCRWMDDEPSWLVDDDQMIVLEYNIKGNGFPNWGRVDRLGDFNRNCLPGAHLRLGIGDRHTVNQHLPSSNQCLNP